MRSKHAFALTFACLVATPVASAGTGVSAQASPADSWLAMAASEPCMNGYVTADGMPDARFTGQLTGMGSAPSDETGS